jgi:hypothetical protein
VECDLCLSECYNFNDKNHNLSSDYYNQIHQQQHHVNRALRPLQASHSKSANTAKPIASSIDLLHVFIHNRRYTVDHGSTSPTISHEVDMKVIQVRKLCKWQKFSFWRIQCAGQLRKQSQVYASLFLECCKFMQELRGCYSIWSGSVALLSYVYE